MIQRIFIFLAKYFLLFCLFVLTNKISPFWGYIAIAVSLLYILTNKTKDDLFLLFFLLPNIRILDVLGFLWSVNILVLCISCKFLLLHIKQIDRKLIFSTLFVFLLGYTHILFVDNVLLELFTSLNITFNFMIGIMLIRQKYTFEQYNYLTYGLILGIMNSVLVALISDPSLLPRLLSSQYRLEAFGNDPNYLSMYIVVGISGLLIKSNYKNLSFIDMFLLIILIIVGLLTASKMCFICLGGLCVIYLGMLITTHKFSSFLIIVFLFTLGTSFILLFFRDFFAYLLQRIWMRFENAFLYSDLSALTTGRSALVAFYIEHMVQSLHSLLWGRGINYVLYYQRFGITHIAHNTYMDLLLSWGIIGCFGFIAVSINCARAYISFLNKQLMNWLPCIMFLIMLFSLSCLASDMFWYLVPFILMPLTINFNKVQSHTV